MRDAQRHAPAERCRAPWTRRSACLALFAALLQGCASVPNDTVPQRTDEQKAEFYWHYAALASSVYDTEGVSEVQMPLVKSSPYLRRAVSAAADAEVARRLDELDEQQAKRIYAGWLGRKGCTGTATSPLPACDVHGRNRAAVDELASAGTERFVDASPAAGGDAVDRGLACDKAEPDVPLTEATTQLGWQRVREVDKYALGRGWRIFVPQLAIDVWRRDRPDVAGEDAVEYAIVFRGTAGAGGWVSNLRILTGLLPFIFWDQYLQAESAALKIVEQIHMLHAVRDSLLGRTSRVLVTAVGHSLGAGLASYVYYKVPAITRVVGFNPSPVDGSHSLIDLDARAKLADPRERPFVDVDPLLRNAGHGYDRTSIYLVYEKGEVLSRLDTCDSGPLWGSEGGPIVLCERVNMSSGSWFSQHRMNQLACKLALQRERARSPLLRAALDQ